MPENPLHELIGILSRFADAVWACHHAANRTEKDERLKAWHEVRGNFWGVYRIPDEAIRSLADPAIAWCCKGGFRDKEDVSLVEMGAGLVARLAQTTRPCANPDIYANKEDAEKTWEEQGNLLLNAYAIRSALRRLAARTGYAWPPKNAAYPNARYPLVGERFSQEQKANLTLQEKARQDGGFPPDCWIPADLAHQWRTVLFPVKPAPEAVKQWTEAMRELGLAYRVAAEDTKAAEQLGMDIAADLSLLGSWVSEEVATKEAGSTATLANDPATKNPPIVLGNPGDNPVVRDQRKDPLTVPQYDVVKALLDAGEAGLTKDELDRKSKHGDARKILKRLADSHPDWEAVIHFPGTTGKRYRIG